MAKAKQQQALALRLEQDNTGIIEMVLEMIDSYVANKPAWVQMIWRYIRAALVGALPQLPAEQVQNASTLDSLIEMVLALIDTYVENSGRPLLKMLWRLIRSQLTPAAIAQSVQEPAAIKAPAQAPTQAPEAAPAG